MIPGRVVPEDFGCVENILAAWVDGESRARLVVDEHLAVYWLSASAEAFLRRDQALVYRNGRLAPRDPRLEQSLRRFLANTSDRLTSECVTNPDTGEHLVLTAVRVQQPWQNVIGLTLHHAGERFDVALADVRQAFGLTRSERQVALHLLHGLTAEETSRELNVTLETVRMHIKRAYAKLGVSSREAFFHRLAPFVLQG